MGRESRRKPTSETTESRIYDSFGCSADFVRGRSAMSITLETDQHEKIEVGVN